MGIAVAGYTPREVGTVRTGPRSAGRFVSRSSRPAAIVMVWRAGIWLGIVLPVHTSKAFARGGNIRVSVERRRREDGVHQLLDRGGREARDRSRLTSSVALDREAGNA